MTIDVDTIEVVWTIVALVGTVLAVDALLVAREDHELTGRQRPSGADARRTWNLECAITRGDVVSAWWVVAQEVANLGVGILAMLSPAPAGGRTIVSWAVISLLIFAAAALPVRLGLARRRRRQIVRGLP